MEHIVAYCTYANITPESAISEYEIFFKQYGDHVKEFSLTGRTLSRFMILQINARAIGMKSRFFFRQF